MTSLCVLVTQISVYFDFGGRIWPIDLIEMALISQISFPGVDLIATFYGCLYAGCVPITVRPPHPQNLATTLPTVKMIVEVGMRPSSPCAWEWLMQPDYLLCHSQCKIS